MENSFIKISGALVLCLPILAQSIHAYAGDASRSPGARAIALGDAGASLPGIASVQNNTAAFASINRMSGALHHENNYLVAGMSTSSFSLAVPIKKAGTFGFCFNYYGYEYFSRKKAGWAFSRSFGEKFSAGLQFSYLNTFIGDGYGSKSSFILEAGIITQLSKKVFLGFHLFNPGRSKLSNTTGERLPTIMRLGLRWHLSEKLLIVAEAEKDISFREIFKAGLEYHIVKELFLRTGLQHIPSVNAFSSYTVPGFGFGLEIKNITIDCASLLHPVLGFSPRISLSYPAK